jgi:hypothetical protein
VVGCRDAVGFHEERAVGAGWAGAGMLRGTPGVSSRGIPATGGGGACWLRSALARKIIGSDRGSRERCPPRRDDRGSRNRRQPGGPERNKKIPAHSYLPFCITQQS